MRQIITNALLDGKKVNLVIEEGIITSVSNEQLAISNEQLVISNAQGCSIFAGLCNMHSHAPMVLLRGVGDDQPLQRWLSDYIWPVEKTFTNETIYQGTLQACKEMIDSGTTFFNDMYFHIPSMAQAVKDSGIQARLGLTIFGDGKELDDTNLLELLCTPSENLSFSIAPHSVYTVSEKGLIRAAKMCQALSLPMHIHMNETKKEVADCLKEHGCRPFEWLERLGVLEICKGNIIAAHCLHLSDNEMALMGRYGVTAVHCPNSNLKLGSGYRFPLLELKDKGVRIALGTDGSASSNNLDMIEAMKVAALLQKGWREDPTVLPANEILDIATLGHKIEVGQEATFFLSRATSVSDLVYASHGESVVATFIKGKQVMGDT